MGASFAGTSRFEVLRVLGQGGVGVVYEVLDREQNARVALKTLIEASPEALLRFKQEFRVLRDLDHPNLVRLHELIEEAGTWFFTMELVEGVDLLTHVLLPEAAVHAPRPQPTSSTPADFPSTPMGMTPGALATAPGRPTRMKLPQAAPAADTVTADTSAGTAVVATNGPYAQAVPDGPPQPRRFDELRLRHAFAQLGEGLEVLHRAGLVHRDVKPSNVLVTPEGRVVILDLGIAAEVADDAEKGVTGMGTLPFMAPEQWLGALPEPASDAYALGVVLYLALTGHLPFTGKARQELAWKKLNTLPVPPAQLCADLPADLESLCLALLERDPAVRPPPAEVARRLSAAPRRRHRRHRSTSAFLGREAELDALLDAFATSQREHRTVAALVTGDSGIGKSTLVRRFRDHVLADQPDTLVLAGRCHERESVPFKAVDGVVDALSRHLRRLPEAEVLPLVPASAGALGQVFPVLQQIEAINRQPVPRGGDEQRRLFSALRELLSRVGDRWPLVVLVDDLQWADSDSLALYAELLRPPGPRLLLVGTQRGDAAGAVSFGEQVPRHVHVTALPVEKAQALARRCLGEAALARPELAEQLAREAAGHPLFITELAQLQGEGEDSAIHAAADAPLRLDDALRQRIARLEPATRRVLEVVALAGVPLPQGLVAEVTELPFAELVGHVATLRAGRLLRSSGLRPSSRVEPYHDRISESLRARLSAEAAGEWHGRLARALEAVPGTAPEILSYHWAGAGQVRPAADAALRAAEEASAALAYLRAARLYQRARELVSGSADAAELLRLDVAHADALVKAGRSGEAAPLFAAAAARASGALALDLQRKAGETYLVSGQVEEGMDTMSRLLRQIGMPPPRTRPAMMLSIGLLRARLKLRGLDARLVEERDVAPEQLLEMDVAWAAGMGLAFVDILQSTWFQQKFLLLALQTGERRRLIRGLVCEAVLVAAGGSRTQGKTALLLARLQALGATVDDPYERGWVACVGAICAYLEGRYHRTLELAEGALPDFERAGLSSSWELDTLRVLLVGSQFMTGRTRDMLTRADEFLRAARDRGDHYEHTLLRTNVPNHVWLVRDDPGFARRMAEEAIAGWSKKGNIVHSLMDVTAQTNIDLYEADGEAAWRRVNAGWKGLQAAYMLDYQHGRVILRELRARAAIAAARRSRSPRSLLKAAERDALAIRSEGSVPSTPFSEMVIAAIRAREGRHAEAIVELRTAVEGFRVAGMALHAEVARRQLGVLLGGDEGAASIRAADAAMRAQAIVDPAKMADTLAPGFG